MLSIMWQRLTNEKSRRLLWRLLAFLGALLVWQIAAWAVGQDFLLSSPLNVLRRLFSLLGEANSYLVFSVSLGRTMLGFALGLAIGCLLAVPAARLPLVETALFPYMVTVRSVPVASFIVLAYIWLSSAELSVFISFLIVLPVIYNSLLGALKARDRGLDEMAGVFHLPFFTRLRYIWIPQVRAALLAAGGACVEIRRGGRADRSCRRHDRRRALQREAISRHPRPLRLDAPHCAGKRGDREGDPCGTATRAR